MSVVLMNPEEVKPLKHKVRKYLKKGYTLSSISKESGVNKTTVHRIKEGVKIGEDNAKRLEEFFLGKSI